MNFVAQNKFGGDVSYIQFNWPYLKMPSVSTPFFSKKSTHISIKTGTFLCDVFTSYRMVSFRDCPKIAKTNRENTSEANLTFKTIITKSTVNWELYVIMISENI